MEKNRNTIPNHREHEELEIVKVSSKKRKSLGFRILRFLFRLVALFVALMLILRLLVAIPFVQNVLIDWTTNYLSNQLETTVEVERIDLAFLDKLVLKGVFVEDLQQDTLLYAKTIKANFRGFQLLYNKLPIKDLHLIDVAFNIKRPKGAYDDNLQFIINRLGSKKSKTKSAFQLSARTIYLKNIQFLQQDAGKGEDLTIFLKKGQIDGAAIDFDEKQLAVDNIEMIGIQSHYTKNKAHPLPPRKIELLQDTVAKEKKKNWYMTLGKLYIDKSNFRYDDERFEKRKDGELDVRHFDAQELKIVASNGKLENNVGTWTVHGITCRERDGFLIQKLAANMEMHREKMAFYDLELVTPDSYIGDTLIFKYNHINDMGYFNDRVDMDVRLNGALLAIKDLLVFAPNLKRNAFFRLNAEEKVLLDGEVYDNINSLRGDRLFLKIGKNATIKGKFSSKNLTDNHEALLNLELERVKTNMESLALLFPNLYIPDQYYRLGNLSFKGRFDGFYTDFVARGTLDTDLGQAIADMKMVIEPDGEGSYSGKLDLINFDLVKWTDNEDFGKITFKSHVEGQGVTAQTVNAKIDANVEEFTFRAYPYENLKIDGIFNKKEFNGAMSIKDANIDLGFNGKVNLNDSIPKFDIRSKITHLDLKALNLSQQDFALSARVDLNFEGNNLDNIIGQGHIQNFDILHHKKEYHIDSIILVSALKPNDYRDIRLSSEVLYGHLIGKFNINQLEKPFLAFFQKYYPAFAKQFKLKTPKILQDSITVAGLKQSQSTLKLNVNVFDTKNLTELFDPKLDNIKNLKLKSSFNNKKHTFKLNINAPYLHYSNVAIHQLSVMSRTKAEKGQFTVKIAQTDIGENLEIPEIIISNRLRGDTIHFQTQVKNITNVFQTLNLNGQLFIHEDLYQVSLLPSDLKIADKQWYIKGNNFLRFGHKNIYTNNFLLQRAAESIELNSVNGRGLELSIKNLPINWLENFVKIRRLDLDGQIFAKVSATDIFKMQGLKVSLQMDSLFLNADYWGTFAANAHTKSLKNPIHAKIDLEKTVKDILGKSEKQTIRIQGDYMPPDAAEVLRTSKRLPTSIAKYVASDNAFNFRIQARNLDFKAAEYFIVEIKKVEGKVNANLLLTGNAKKPKMKGSIKLKNAGFEIDYLKTFYKIPKGEVLVNDSEFRVKAPFNKLYDKFQNVATINGAMTHNHLKDLKLNVNLTTNKFLLLDTKKTDNDLFYGTGIGSATVRFTGPLKASHLYVNATSDKGTRIAIPLISEQKAKAVNFITFKKEKDTVSTTTAKKAVKIRGMSIETELNINEKAEVMMIYDEHVGDVMKGRGNGNIKLNVKNTGGKFKMFGTYEITSGNYLFTYQNFINKPFTVRKGGTISWNGDPYGAKLNLEAFYKGLRTSTYNFIVEYLSTDSDIELARRKTDVDLVMKLRGDLLKPDIDFDIVFPNVNQQAAIASYIDSKLRTVRADKNELNKQVFGLIMLRSFLPSDQGFLYGSQVSDLGFNTLSELLSNQLSLYLTSLLSEFIAEDVNFISGIEFDFNFQVQSDQAALNLSPAMFRDVNSEFQFNLRNRLFDDKVIVGGNFGFENSGSSGTYFTGDFAIEYVLTEDGRFKIRGYRRTEPDLTQQRNKTGIGASYRIEFDSFRKKKKRKTTPKPNVEKKAEKIILPPPSKIIDKPETK